MLAWRSGRRAQRPIWRLLPIIIIAFAISAAFGVASIFSSNVTSETLNQVLLKGTRCGAFNPLKTNNVYKQLTVMQPLQAEKAIKYLNYGMQCYNNDTHVDGCNLYIKPRLPLVSKRGQPCPFGDNICKLENDNLEMDTGYLDSLEDLGINTAPDARFQFRMVHKCAPLKTQPYMQDYNDSDYGAVKRYMYGSAVNIRNTINWTYEVPLNNAYLPGDGTSSANIPRLDYKLGTEKHFGTPNETLLSSINPWTPIPALHPVDADIHLAFLSAPEIHYSAPINDAWFSARTNTSEISNLKSRTKFAAFIQDEPLGVMACTHQVQYCNPNLPEGQRCEPLRGIADPRASENVKKIFAKDSHFAVVKWVDSVWGSSLYTISSTLGYIGASALRARYSLSYGYSGPLPDDQWQLEAEHWVKGELASLQDIFVVSANGIPQALEEFRDPPLANDTVAQNLCANQKIVSNSYSSFNVLGVSLILIFGIIIIVLDMSLEPYIAWWQRRKYRKYQTRQESLESDKTSANYLYGAIEWSQTGMLQLQRLAHEEAGYGEWSKCDQDVPVTEPGQLISTLDLRKVLHPRLFSRNETSISEWEGVVPPKPWVVGRSDTGSEMMAEEAEEEKKGKLGGESIDDIQVVVRSLTTHETGLGVQPESKHTAS